MNCKLDTKSFQVCRTCIEEISTSSFFCLDSTQADTQLTIKQKLSYCIPELDLDIASNSIICDKCAESINSVYDFKNKCLQSELQFHKYMQQVQHTDDIDLAEVVCFQQPYLINLSELKTEVLEIKDDKIEECTSTLCNANDFSEAEECAQHVVFYTDENYVNCNTLSVEENSHTYYNSNCVPQVDCIKNKHAMGKRPKVTVEELKRQKREREHERRRKIREDPVKREHQKQKERQKYIRQKEQKIRKSIKDMSPREQRQKRKEWKNYTKVHRLRKKEEAVQYEELEENTPPPPDHEN